MLLIDRKWTYSIAEINAASESECVSALLEVFHFPVNACDKVGEVLATLNVSMVSLWPLSQYVDSAPPCLYSD
jgi:hypothetical protein